MLPLLLLFLVDDLERERAAAKAWAEAAKPSRPVVAKADPLAEARRLLTIARERLRTVSRYHAHYERIESIPGGESAHRWAGDVEIRGANYVRMDDGKRSVVWTGGNTMHVTGIPIIGSSDRPLSEAITRGESRRTIDQAGIAKMLARFVAVKAEASIDGERLTKEAGGFTHRLWIDATSGLPYRAELWQGPKRLEAYRYTNLETR